MYSDYRDSDKEMKPAHNKCYKWCSDINPSKTVTHAMGTFNFTLFIQLHTLPVNVEYLMHITNTDKVFKKRTEMTKRKAYSKLYNSRAQRG